MRSRKHAALLGEPGRVTRILVQSRPGTARDSVAARLQRLAGGRTDRRRLRTGHRPASPGAAPERAGERAVRGHRRAARVPARVQRDPADVPERREAIADLRLSGTTRSAIVQLACLPGAVPRRRRQRRSGSAVGYLLSRWVFHQSTGYLAEAFALERRRRSSSPTRCCSRALGGVLVTCLASSVPLLDLRRGAPPTRSTCPGGLARQCAHRRRAAPAVGSRARAAGARERAVRSRARAAR